MGLFPFLRHRAIQFVQNNDDWRGDAFDEDHADDDVVGRNLVNVIGIFTGAFKTDTRHFFAINDGVVIATLKGYKNRSEAK